MFQSSRIWSRLGPAIACVTMLGVTPPARADVFVVIDNATQRMTVAVDAKSLHEFKTSTGRYGLGTPRGTYKPERLHRYWYSRKYDNAPMPYSIFFHGPFAIHGTTVISRLGRPASHGCVRLHPKDAATLFALVKKAGRDKTTISVVGTIPRLQRQVRKKTRRYRTHTTRRARFRQRENVSMW